MNLKKRLRHLADKAMATKDYGKSETLIKACKDLDGTWIAASPEAANHTQKTHDVISLNIERNLEGVRGPFFFDHKAIAKMFRRAADKIEQLEEQATENEMLKKRVEELEAELSQERVASYGGRP